MYFSILRTPNALNLMTFGIPVNTEKLQSYESVRKQCRRQI